uniref:MULE transposase domain-containing protein n=1 Tax=Lactuca sativa TaxID=4236 RepID=A0A9R1WK21_LACSA|nr:hypothetical protein LSAT_V11C100001510 [Lactuca sativa]
MHGVIAPKHQNTLFMKVFAQQPSFGPLKPNHLASKDLSRLRSEFGSEIEEEVGDDSCIDDGENENKIDNLKDVEVESNEDIITMNRKQGDEFVNKLCVEEEEGNDNNIDDDGVKRRKIRATKYALQLVDGALVEHYAKLWSYAEEIRRSNPCSTVKLDVNYMPDGKNYFSKFYVCFDTLKKGWKEVCRKIIGLDSCFLKGICKGELLCAVRRDANNGIYPIAWEVVCVVNKENWKWFLDLLIDDLELNLGYGYNIISYQLKISIENEILDSIDYEELINQFAIKNDRRASRIVGLRAFFYPSRPGHLNLQNRPCKGLIEAVKELLPYVENMQCAKHISQNLRKRYSGAQYETIFWKACKATIEVDFKISMKELEDLDLSAHKYLMDRDPKHGQESTMKLEDVVMLWRMECMKVSMLWLLMLGRRQLSPFHNITTIKHKTVAMVDPCWNFFELAGNSQVWTMMRENHISGPDLDGDGDGKHRSGQEFADLDDGGGGNRKSRL